MLSKIIKGYKHIFLSAAKIILLVALCIGAGIAIVLPLWKWAVVSPASYSAVMLALIVAFATYGIIKICLKTPKYVLLRRFIKTLLTAAEIYIFINRVFALNRIAAVVSLAIYALVISFVSIAMKNTKSEVR